jgi:acyl-CoA thioesterase I
MVDAAQAHGARVALMAVPQPSAIGLLTGLSAAAFYTQFAQRRKIVLIARALPAVLSDASLKIDALHPNLEGHRALAERAAVELADAGLLRRR